MGVLAYLAFTMMVNAIPEGQPIAQAKVTEGFNDPRDLSPREPSIPMGKHRDEFLNNCIACHSSRLTMTQPSFPQTKWTEVVHKMVATYGAKIEPAVEVEIVKYLTEVKGVK